MAPYQKEPLIPKPADKGHKALQKAMRLEHDKHTWIKFRMEVKFWIDQLLDPALNWRNQPKEKVDTFWNTVIAECPILARYQGAWPAEIYAQRCLWISKHALKNAMDREAESTGKGENGAKSMDRRGRHSTTIVPMRDNNLSENVSRPDSHPRPFISCTSSERPPTFDAPDMEAFLGSRQLSALVPKFVAAGIRDHASILGLAKMSEMECEGLLKVDMGLSAYEFRMIREALAMIYTPRQSNTLLRPLL